MLCYSHVTLKFILSIKTLITCPSVRLAKWSTKMWEKYASIKIKIMSWKVNVLYAFCIWRATVQLVMNGWRQLFRCRYIYQNVHVPANLILCLTNKFCRITLNFNVKTFLANSIKVQFKKYYNKCKTIYLSYKRKLYNQYSKH